MKLKLIDRNKKLFTEDANSNKVELKSIVFSSKFLVLGGTGSIGLVVIKEIKSSTSFI